MSATECLREEHQLIWQVLECFDVALAEVRASGTLEMAKIEPFLTFFRDFADRCHHGREEICLFPCMERCGHRRDSGTLRRLLDEHAMGRRRVAMMFEQLNDAAEGDAVARDMLLDQAERFRDLLRGHIGTEDFDFFKTADREISGNELETLLASYGESMGDLDMQSRNERGREVAAALLEQFGPAPETGG